MIGGSYESERILPGNRRVSLRDLVRRRVAGDGIQACLRHPVGDEFELARRGRKFGGKRHERIRIIQPDRAARLERLQRDASQRWMAAIQDLPRNRLIAVVQRRLIETHLAREAPEYLCRWQALA